MRGLSVTPFLQVLAKCVKGVKSVGVLLLSPGLVGDAQPVDVVVLAQQIDQVDERGARALAVRGVDDALQGQLRPADVAALLHPEPSQGGSRVNAPAITPRCWCAGTC